MPAWFSSPRPFFQKSIDTAQAAGLPSEPPPLLRTALATHFLLAGASAAELDALVMVCAPVRLTPGERLFPLASNDDAGAAPRSDDGAVAAITSGGRALAPGPMHTCYVLTDGALEPEATAPAGSQAPHAAAGLAAAKCLNPLGLVGGGSYSGTGHAVVDLVAAPDGAVRFCFCFLLFSMSARFARCAPYTFCGSGVRLLDVSPRKFLLELFAETATLTTSFYLSRQKKLFFKVVWGLALEDFRAAMAETQLAVQRDRVQFLTSTQLLGCAPPQLLAQFAEAMHEVVFEPGEAVMVRGDVGEHLFVVTHGQVAKSHFETLPPLRSPSPLSPFPFVPSSASFFSSRAPPPFFLLIYFYWAALLSAPCAVTCDTATCARPTPSFDSALNPAVLPGGSAGRVGRPCARHAGPRQLRRRNGAPAAARPEVCHRARRCRRFRGHVLGARPRALSGVARGARRVDHHHAPERGGGGRRRGAPRGGAPARKTAARPGTGQEALFF